MAISTQLTMWPTTAITLREILNVDSGPKIKCHHILESQKRRCKNPIKKDNTTRISELLEQIVLKGSLKAAKTILAQLSKLVVCKHNHQLYGSKVLTRWEKQLEAIEEPIVIKKEETNEQKITTYTKVEIVKEEAHRETRKLLLASVPKIKIEDSDDSEDESIQDTSFLSVKTSSSSRRTSLSSHTIPEAPSTTELHALGPKRKFKPYAAVRTLMQTNQAIRNYILRPLTITETYKDGTIYIYTYPTMYRDAHPYLKIGYSKDVKQRMAKWKQQCHYEPRELSHFTTDHYVKVEQLAHNQLRNHRKKEDGCPACGIEHDEWFDVTSTRASAVVSMWADWMRRQPYDGEGKLRKTWKDRLDDVEPFMNDPRCWEYFINGVEKSESESDSESD